MMNSPAIELEHVSRRFDDVLAVDDVTFSVRHGSICAVLGGNGAGKTTLLSMLLGLLLPTAGRLSVPYVDLPQRLTVHENLCVYARLYSVRQFRQRLVDLAEQLEIERFLDRVYGTLSAGQKTRVALAKALLNRPDVLLLDEPTASLDPETAGTIRGLLRRYQRESGATLLMASHNMLEVERLCDDVIMLRAGRIVDRGSPADLLERYSRSTLEDVFIDVAREAGGSSPEGRVQ